MEKITIDGVEYDVDKLKESVSKAEDYTQKTQRLAEERRALEERASQVESYENMFQYAEVNPKFRSKLERLLKIEEKKIKGIPVDEDDEDVEDFDTGSDYLDSGTKKSKKKAKIATQDDVEMAVNSAVQKVMTLQQQKEATNNMQKEFEKLQSVGYTQDELTRIGDYAKKNYIYSPKVAAEALIGIEALPNRFKKKQDEPVALLKGMAASGFDIPEPEKELIKYGGDPTEMLKANAHKLIIDEE